MVRRLSLLVVLAFGGSLLAMPGVAAGGTCHATPSARMTISDETRIVIEECAFTQTVTYVDPGESVTWVSREVFPHTVTGAAGSWGNEDILDSGDRVTYAFEKDGVYPYYCALHPSMVGAVVVGDGTNEAVLDAGSAAVTKVKNAAPVGAAESDPPGSGGIEPAVVALSLVAALGAVFVAGRYALARRARASTAA
ncbi:MAG: plastocyanin/azurin family copper-binding protein [Actinomycetota bacterium]|nr:plastocyanin/azurin family copper-binding protein [Actinomycetota bacterium]